MAIDLEKGSYSAISLMAEYLLIILLFPFTI